MWCVLFRTAPDRLVLENAVGTFAFAAPEMLLGVDSGVKVPPLLPPPPPRSIALKYFFLNWRCRH